MHCLLKLPIARPRPPAPGGWRQRRRLLIVIAGDPESDRRQGSTPSPTTTTSLLTAVMVMIRGHCRRKRQQVVFFFLFCSADGLNSRLPFAAFPSAKHQLPFSYQRPHHRYQPTVPPDPPVAPQRTPTHSLPFHNPRGTSLLARLPAFPPRIANERTKHSDFDK